MSIVVTDLLKIYGEQKAVDRISFTVNKGEIVGFLGPNGAGKSTTMKMITGYLKPDAGSVTVAGINVAENPLLAKSKIGYNIVAPSKTAILTLVASVYSALLASKLLVLQAIAN